MIRGFFLLALVLLASPAVLRAEERPEKWATVREFVSNSGEYKLETAQNAFTGPDGARLRFMNGAGKVLNEFRLRRPPLFVSVLDDGLRLAVFYSGGGSMPGPNYLEFYDALSGKLVNSKQVIITSRTWEKLSDDHKIYALGYNSANSGELHLFDVRTGAELWNNKFKNTFNGLMMSGDGKWFAAVFAAGPGRWRIALLDAAGGEAWSEEEKTENSCAPVAIAADGSSFEIRESRLVYSKETDRSQRTEMNRTRYKNSGGKVERTGSSAGGLTQEHKPVEEEKGARHD